MARLDLGWPLLSARNPRLIYCAISGYGQTGPRSGEAGHDLNYQAVTGHLSLSPGTDTAPSVPPALTADIAGGAFPAVINILLALRQREATGRGAFLDIAMADAMFTFSWIALAAGHAAGTYPGAREMPLNGSGPRYQLYCTSDQRFVAVGALEQKFWIAFCEAIGLPEALRDDRRDPAATLDAVRRIIAAEPAAHWAARLPAHDCCATVVASLAEALADPHFRARGLFARQVALPSGMLFPAIQLPIAESLRRPPDEAAPVDGEPRARH
jgi:crotonobetainyl-CoA:carnitine CoA-transferase CaiB-like acyl-CoA transferase